MEPDEIIDDQAVEETGANDAAPPKCWHVRVMRPDGQFYTHAFSPDEFDEFNCAGVTDHLVRKGLTAYSGREADFYRPVRELAAGGAPVPIWFSVSDGNGWNHYELLTFIQ